MRGVMVTIVRGIEMMVENRQNSIRVLWVHFDFVKTVKTPIGWILIHFSKTTAKKVQNHTLFYFTTMFL
jgi:hypothetical protein